MDSSDFGRQGMIRANYARKWHIRLRCAAEEIGHHQDLLSTPNGIRTRAATLKGWKLFIQRNWESAGQKLFLTKRAREN